MKHLFFIIMIAGIFACNHNPTQETITDNTIANQKTANLPVFKGILTYGKSLREFQKLPEGTIYHIRDNSHQLKRIIDSLHLVTNESVYIEFIVDSIVKTNINEGSDYKEIVYLKRILKFSEEYKNDKQSAKDTVVVSKEKKVCFKAMGNEPAWYITLEADEIKLNLNMGQQKYIFPNKHALRYKESTVVKTQNADATAYLIISDEKCFDSMSGREFGHRTKLILNDSLAYFGCGNFVTNCK